jgi:hypothetical protein
MLSVVVVCGLAAAGAKRMFKPRAHFMVTGLKKCICRVLTEKKTG